jgi:peptidoglycan/xylan/chitin deacetylase (PgdA/CDA1 family)
MKARVLMYHDVVAPGRHEASGFGGADAALYKLERAAFAAHLDALAALPPPATALEDAAWLITFDDGGASACETIAPALEAKNWRGWFFMTTDRLGDAAFLSAAQLRELRARGHVVGSHSCSHPPRFSHLARADMLREWRDSRAKLSDILGAEVVAASVPGGFYSRDAARAAAEAGLKVLFTSEPTDKIATVDGCLVAGRYAVQRATPPQIAAALAAGRFLPAARQAALWQAKKLAKRAGGTAYLKLRRALLR